MKNTQIKAILLAHGYKEKDQGDGCMDLNPYVYDAAWALISAFAPPANLRRQIDDSLLFCLIKAYEEALSSEPEGAQGMVNAMRRGINEMLRLSPPNVWATITRMVGHDEHSFDDWYQAHGKALLTYELGCDDLMQAAWDGALARHPSPRTSVRSARSLEELEAQDAELHVAIHDILSSYRLQEQQDENESGYPLVDALTSDDAESISSGQREIERLTDALFNDLQERLGLHRSSLESQRELADWNRQIAGAIAQDRAQLQAEVIRLQQQLRKLIPLAEGAVEMLAEHCPNSIVGNELHRIVGEIASTAVGHPQAPSPVSMPETPVGDLTDPGTAEPKVAVWVVAQPGAPRYFPRLEEALKGDRQIEPIALITRQDHRSSVAHLGQFKNAVIDALVINHGLTAEHETNPVKALADLIKIEVAMATDPAISKSARALANAERDLASIRQTCDRASACITRWESGHAFNAAGPESTIRDEL